MLNLILEYNRKLLKKKFTHDALIQTLFKKKISSNPNWYTCYCRMPSQYGAAVGRCWPRVEEARIITCMISLQYGMAAWISSVL